MAGKIIIVSFVLVFAVGCLRVRATFQSPVLMTGKYFFETRDRNVP